MNDDNNITYFAETDARNKRVKFGIKDSDRLRHIYSIGKTGMGKSTMLENMAIQDIQNGNGMAFLDPHGKTADLLLEYIPEHRIKDVIYFAPFDTEYPISFNVMEDVGPMRRHLVLSGLMSAFEKLFGEESFSDRMQYILQNTILALLEFPDATMLGINRMLTEKAYRQKVVDNVTDTSVKEYWTKEFASYTDRFAAEATPAIQNKIGQFTSNPLIRNIIGQPKSSIDMRKIMDEKKILIVNLSKGLVGESNANLLGSMIVTKIYLAAMSRADASPGVLKKLPNFYLYVDEFQSFANKSFADILSEARKYKLSLNITHQYIEQMPEEVRAAVFGNVGTMVTFRVGSYDAEVLEKEFTPVFTMEDLVNLGFVQIYLKLMIDGVASQPFSATTLPPIAKPEKSFKEEVCESSRKIYAHPRGEVEKTINDWYAAPLTPVSKKEQKGEVAEKSVAIKPSPTDTRKNTPPESTVLKENVPPPKSVRKSESSNTPNNSLKDAILNIAPKITELQKPKENPEAKVGEQKSPSPRAMSDQTKFEELKQSVSLQSLKNDSKNKNKEATIGNINALREALERAKADFAKSSQSSQNKNKVEVETKKPEVKEEIKKVESKTDSTKNQSMPKEVPEDVLRKVLKGE